MPLILQVINGLTFPLKDALNKYAIVQNILQVNKSKSHLNYVQCGGLLKIYKS